MMYLLLSILFTTLVFITIKEFSRYKIANFQAIVVSYWMAVCIGGLLGEGCFLPNVLLAKKWFYGAVSIAVLFISVFNIMAITAQKGGLSVMTIANKMSVVIPIIAGVLLYNEKLDSLKIAGIVLAMFGVWMVSVKKEMQNFNKRLWYFPLLIFTGSGLADAIINHMQTLFVPSYELALFTTSLFLFCGVIGGVICIVKWMLGRLQISVRSVVGGLVLGVPNYFSIYFLLKALSQTNCQSSLVFSLNNLLVVLLSVVLGVFLYKEKLSKQNYVGVGMSVLAIIILYFVL